MPIVALKAGQSRVLDTFLAGVPLQVGLFRNDRTPKVTDTLAAYTEADFSGYGGRLITTNWTPAVYQSFRAESQADSLAWAQNGGATTNLIYGVFWVDALGVLLFAERDLRAPVLLDPDHRIYTYKPVLTVTAEYAP